MGDFDLPLRAEDAGLRRLLLVDPFIDFGRRRGILVKQRRVAHDLGLGVGERRLLREKLGLRLLQLRLVLRLLHGEEKIAFFDQRAVLEVNLVEIAFDARDQLDDIGRGRRTGDDDVVGHSLNRRLHHRNFRPLGWRLRFYGAGAG